MRFLVLVSVLVVLSGCASLKKNTAILMKGMGDGLKSVPAQSSYVCDPNYVGGYNCHN